MNIAYLGVSLALDQDRESGIELLFRVVEQLKLAGLHPTETKELELQITAFDEFLVDLEVKNSEENYLLKKLNLILKNLGSSLIKHNLNTLFRKNKRLKSLVTYLSSLRSIAIRSKEVTEIDIVDRSLEDFESSPYPGHMSTLKIKELWKKEHLSNIDDIERNEHFLHAVYSTYLHDFDLTLLDKKDYSLLTIYDLDKTNIQSIRIVDSYKAPTQHDV